MAASRTLPSFLIILYVRLNADFIRKACKMNPIVNRIIEKKDFVGFNISIMMNSDI